MNPMRHPVRHLMAIIHDTLNTRQLATQRRDDIMIIDLAPRRAGSERCRDHWKHWRHHGVVDCTDYQGWM